MQRYSLLRGLGSIPGVDIFHFSNNHVPDLVHWRNNKRMMGLTLGPSNLEMVDPTFQVTGDHGGPPYHNNARSSAVVGQ